MNDVFLVLSLGTFLITLFLYFNLKRKRKNFIVLGGLAAIVVTTILVLSGICTILNFIFRYII